MITGTFYLCIILWNAAHAHMKPMVRPATIHENYIIQKQKLRAECFVIPSSIIIILAVFVIFVILYCCCMFTCIG